MNMLSDVITYVRRIIKSPSNAVITDALIIDYINRFWIMDVDARMQLFDLKTTYQFQTQPAVDKYNMPLYSIQSETPNNPGSQDIAMYPVYQGFLSPAYINGVEIFFETQEHEFYRKWPKWVQNNRIVGIGNGTPGPYFLKLPVLPEFYFHHTPPLQGILRGHIDIAGIISTGFNQDPPLIGSTQLLNNNFIQPMNTTSVHSQFYLTSTDNTGANVIVADSGQFLQQDVNLGILMQPGNAPFGNLPLPGGYANSFTITGISAPGNPTVLTATTTFFTGQIVIINGVVGMTQLNNNKYKILAVTSTTVTIDVDSTDFDTYVSGGTVFTIQNVVNYLTGFVDQVFFPSAIPLGQNIHAQYLYFQTGLPRAMLYYNNTITLRSPPDRQYLVEIEAYLTPAAFFSTSQALPFAYMAEYIARGAARKILSDTGDVEQFQFYEPLFREQENLVWKRSQRQWTATRTQTIYSHGHGGTQNTGINGAAT